MQARTLGRSDVKVSPVIFGAWAIGGWMWGGSEESESIAAIHASLDAGVNTIDTAAIYGMGYSEEVVAKAIKGRRDKPRTIDDQLDDPRARNHRGAGRGAQRRAGPPQRRRDEFHAKRGGARRDSRSIR